MRLHRLYGEHKNNYIILIDAMSLDCLMFSPRASMFAIFSPVLDLTIKYGVTKSVNSEETSNQHGEGE